VLDEVSDAFDEPDSDDALDELESPFDEEPDEEPVDEPVDVDLPRLSVL
jgi:hypothetical protein